MSPSSLLRAALAALLVASFAPPVRAQSIHEVALEIPSDGGAMVMYSLSWRLARFVWAGIMAGGGQIDHNFDLEAPDQTTYSARASTLVLPIVGPRVTFVFPIIAVSVGYAAFYGRTNLDVHVPGVGTLSGKKSAWGAGFYSPLISLDVYSKKQDLIYGIGLGGFFGTSFPDLTASGNGMTVRTNENPINTLTFHLKVGWDGGWLDRRRRRQNVDDF